MSPVANAGKLNAPVKPQIDPRTRRRRGSASCRIRALIPALAALVAPTSCAATPEPAPVERPAAPASVEFAAWEPAAFERAAADNKLILINVIATWCHWCHVMDEKTFANPEVARLLSEHFVVIRVDSDARPDVSERYRAWGWPATAFLSPSAEPVLTLRGYRNPQVFAELLRELIAEHERGELRRPETEAPESAPVDADLAQIRDFARAKLDAYFEPERLGWGDQQKYPWPEPIEYAFMRARVHGDALWQPRALATLAAQRALIDPVDGGMYQYSLGGVWDQPHFEKIAMIQAGAIETYAHAAMITGDARWLDDANAVLRYVLERFEHPRGGFHTSQDADLRQADGATIAGADYYSLAAEQRRELGEPRIDTAVYADLNGLIIHALTELYRASGDARALAAAVRAGERLLATHRRPDGGFSHAPLADMPEGALVYLADQAALGWAFVGLHRTTGDARWLDAATGIARFMHVQLAAPDGGYHAHSVDPSAVGVFAKRRVPLPENALAAEFLIELHQLVDGDGSGESPLLERARAALLAVGSEAEIRSRGKVLGRYLIALELYLATRVDVTVVAAPGDPQGDALWRAALGYWEPRAAIERSAPGQRYPELGKPAIYVCSDQACSKPITEPARFADEAAAFLGREP